MKLVDILARELKVWPKMTEGGTRLEQDINNAVIEGDGCGTVDLFMLSERADDQKGAHVSKSEWQDAVDALNAPKVVEWDGKGNPPAGSSIEYSIGDGWYSCEVRYVLNRDDYPGIALVAWCEHLGKDQYLSNDRDHKFRPTRTAEQVAAEEREKARTEVLNAMTANGKTANEPEALWQFRLKVVGEMLDMGYRKDTKPCGS